MGSIDTTITADDGTIVELMLDFEVTLLGIVISGTGTFDDPTNGYSGEATVSPGDPLTVRPADGGVMNLCTLSAEGNVNTEIMGPDSWYTGVFQFDFGSPTATITNAAQGPDEQSAEPVADSSVDLGCRPSLQDWVGTFDMNYVCPPGGGGQETHTFVVTGPNTLQVSKAPAGGGAPTVFTATADPDDPHTVRGEFTEADSEGTYTEVFVYTLTPDGSVFTQDNEFTYIDGPSQGLGGPCFGTAKKR